MTPDKLTELKKEAGDLIRICIDEAVESSPFDSLPLIVPIIDRSFKLGVEAALERVENQELYTFGAEFPGTKEQKLERKGFSEGLQHGIDRSVQAVSSLLKEVE